MRALQEYAGLLKEDGPWCSIHADVSTGTVDTLEATDVLGDNISALLADAGADRASVEAAGRLTWAAKGLPAPVSRFVLVRGGEIVVNEVLPGAPAQPLVEVGPVPNLLPLAEHRAGDLVYLEVEAERADAEIRLHRASSPSPVAEQEVHGDTENLKKVPSGGWSQGRYQRRTEEVWRRNGADVAKEVDRIVEAGGVDLVVLSGDERAQEKIRESLGDRAAGLVRTVAMNSSAPGADREKYQQQVELLVAEVSAARQARLLERMAEGRGARAAYGWGLTVRALQEARVDTLVLCQEAAAERSVLALGGAPWVASTEAEAVGAGVLGQADPAAALLRAAVLTDADTILVPRGVLDSDEVAALLRWE
ncbi:Vms1/Ankzf1 family peptidyl-tRNA hydrolase [Sinomonas halotolerans]|uniref:Vms1/Ankzf1 family peptidyl-tRNA hydrolase n=1 Tax=Sinomonas halotolerans TaxID=1644133 RepID=A0ABU9WZJ5_9MICC